MSERANLDKGLPGFMSGRTLCARADELDAWKARGQPNRRKRAEGSYPVPLCNLRLCGASFRCLGPPRDRRSWFAG